jgi:hypothetical protein
MHLEFYLILAILVLSPLTTDGDLHNIVKRNRFKMKDKAVMYNDSLEDDEDQTKLLTTLKPINTLDEEEVSDTEREIKRLAEQMKKGVNHINMEEYINEEDADLGTNDETTSTKLSPTTLKSHLKKAS